MGLFDNITKKTQNVIKGAVAGNDYMYYPHPASLMNSVPTGIADTTPWEPVTGTAREFSLFGRTLKISEEQDSFNTYRLRFRQMAQKYADFAERTYRSQIHDYITFTERFPTLYDSNLYPLLKYAMDILVSADVWTITPEAFSLKHKEKRHLAIDVYNAITDVSEQVTSNNSKVMSKTGSFIMDIIPHKSSGISLIDEGFDKFRSFAVDTTSEVMSGLSKEQQKILYGRIETEPLMLRIFLDYWEVYATLVETLQQNGCKIAFYDTATAEKAASIFKNLSLESFPAPKRKEALLEALSLYPYKREYFTFMAEKGEDNDELVAVRQYFGYADLNNPRDF